MRSQKEVEARLRKAEEKEEAIVKSRDEQRRQAEAAGSDLGADYWTAVWNLHLVRAELRVLKWVLGGGAE